jgi:hypothetical protein
MQSDFRGVSIARRTASNLMPGIRRGVLRGIAAFPGTAGTLLAASAAQDSYQLVGMMVTGVIALSRYAQRRRAFTAAGIVRLFEELNTWIIARRVR